MSELKSGDSLEFVIGDKTLTIEPVPYGNIKKIVKIAFEASQTISSGGLLASMPDLIDQNLFKVFPLMFPVGKYPFLTNEWIENTMTVPVLRKMLEAAVVVNGLQDFFDKATGRRSPASQPTPATLPENPGSTTSSDSPTDGGPKTLTN